MNRGRTLAVAAILFTTVAWGLSFVSTKSLLARGLTPVQVACARFVIASAIFLALRGARIASSERAARSESAGGTWSMTPRAPAGNRIRVLAGGLLGVPVYFILENTGLRFTSASTASLITGMVPVINACAMILLLHDKVRGRQWAGIAMSCAGVYSVVQADLAGSLSGRAMLGNLLVLLSACSWVAYTMVNQPLLDYYDNLSLNTYQNLAGTSVLLPLALYEGMPVAAWGREVWLHLLYLGIVCSASSYVFYLFALKRLGPTVVTSFLNLVPFFGVLGGVALLGESLSWTKALGGALAVAGVYTVSVGNASRRSRPARLGEAKGSRGLHRNG